MPLTADQIQELRGMLPEDEILEPSSPAFASHSVPWSLAYDKGPRLVLCPSTEPRLQKVVAYLCASDLDFAVRSRGLGSSSAADVVLSLRAFSDFVWDADREVAEVGAGCKPNSRNYRLCLPITPFFLQ